MKIFILIFFFSLFYVSAKWEKLDNIYFISFQFSMFIFSLYKNCMKKVFYHLYIFMKKKEVSKATRNFFLALLSMLLFSFYKWYCAIEWKWFQIVSIYYYSRVSVIRGQVITPQGLGIIGIRVSVDKDARFGFTLTRSGGWWVFMFLNDHLNCSCRHHALFVKISKLHCAL